MKIRTTNTTPSPQELVRVLNTKISDGSAKLFGLGSDKTIIVKKSTFVGVQITRRNHELVIEGTLPSFSSFLLSGFLMLDGIFYLLEFIFHKQWNKLERQVGNTLRQQYN